VAGIVSAKNVNKDKEWIMHEKILDQYTSDLGGVILAYAKDEESMPYSVRFSVNQKLGFKLFWTLFTASDYFQEIKITIQSK
jgi:hypothetical protein